MIVPLPGITHLQFLVMASLFDGEQSGRFLRQKLEEDGERKSGPAFYQMMARLEDAGLVRGRYDQKIVEGQIIKERRYCITATGTTACRRAYEFYHQRSEAFVNRGFASA
jgi:DNA-binding PadR family transcriptional regulator